MNTFDKRRKAAEKGFEIDQATSFKIDVRANKLLGTWASNKLGHSGDEEANYIQDVIKSDFKETGREDVYRKVIDDLEGIVDEATIREVGERFYEEAKEQILSE
ncbi:MAG: DUF1476 domain-containing protein [Rhodobacteraceae bacterium]|nr:DUF1476 domain-containing protein [Paracoccaceae bacterium]